MNYQSTEILTQKVMNYIFLKSGRSWIKINKNDILYIQSSGAYSVVVCTDKNIIVNVKISDMVQTIGHYEQFIRIHKRYVINLNHLFKVTRTNLQIGETTLPIGKTYIDTITKLIQQTI